MEEEFTEYHKDSFSRAKPDAPKQAAAKPAPKPAAAKNDNLDDYVPEKVGKVVDNVFGKLDNLVNDATDYLFGGKKKGGLLDDNPLTQKQVPPQVPPLQPIQAPVLKPLEVPTTPPPAAPAAKATPAAKAPAARKAAPAPAASTVRTISTLQSSRQPEMIQPVMPEAKPRHEGPVISRTTAISELDLPLEMLADKDLSRYFDQMKLYEGKVVEGGLCNLPQYEATQVLRRGKWGSDFGVHFEDLKGIQPGINPMEMAKSRFHGMRPVYKAQAHKYQGAESLVKAITEDINAYLAGKQGKHFHPFIYQVVSTVIK